MLNAAHHGETQQIWAEFGHRLRGFIARRVESEADAEDILQEVFLRVHRHAASVEQRERLASWLFQITRNAIADYYRAPGRRREFPAGAPADLEIVSAPAWGDLTGHDHESPAVRRELASCLRPMVEHLPAHYGDALRLVDLEGLPQHEAAARAGLSVSGMKSRVQRGRLALQQSLHECCRIELDASGRVADYEPRGSLLRIVRQRVWLRQRGIPRWGEGAWRPLHLAPAARHRRRRGSQTEAPSLPIIAIAEKDWPLRAPVFLRCPAPDQGDDALQAGRRRRCIPVD